MDNLNLGIKPKLKPKVYKFRLCILSVSKLLVYFIRHYLVTEQAHDPPDVKRRNNALPSSSTQDISCEAPHFASESHVRSYILGCCCLIADNIRGYIAVLREANPVTIIQQRRQNGKGDYTAVGNRHKDAYQ